jgi:hypothetical protein
VCLGGKLDSGWVYGRLVSGVGWGGGSEVLLEQVRQNFSCRNESIFILPCGLIVDNNTFLKMRVFVIFTGHNDDGYENRNSYVVIIIIMIISQNQ